MTSSAAWLILAPAAAFILGSVPFGLLIGRFARGVDLRELGSGNIGAVNAIRALGWGWGGLVFLLDVGKGVAAAALGAWAASAAAYPNLACLMVVISGLVGILGHNYSIFLKGKGGKGIATSLGVMLYLSWQSALVGVAVWGLMVALTRYSSVGSLTGSLAVLISLAVFHAPVEYIGFGALACAFAILRHKANIKRLLRGEELKITQTGGAPGEAPPPAAAESEPPASAPETSASESQAAQLNESEQAHVR